MKHLNEWNVFKNKKEEGDKIVSRIIEIIKNENIPIKDTGGFQVEIDNKIYSFSKLGFSECILSIFDKSQQITSGKWRGVIEGKPISKYKFSKKLWKELERLYKEQTQNDYKSDLEVLKPLTRKTKKFNL